MTNVTLAIADRTKAIARAEALVAKRSEMLDAADKEAEKVDFKVRRRREILGEHIAVLQALIAEQAKDEAASAEASADEPADDEEAGEDE
jgi:hypothetical protein